VGSDEYLAVHDGRGSVGALYSAVSNRVVAALDYTPEGRTGWRTFDASGNETSNCEERDSDATCGGALGVPFGFHTALKSEATGLLYFRNRWYSTTAGQWLSQDPLGPVDSHNLYAFNGFDSVNFVDPWGLNDGPQGPAVQGAPPNQPSNPDEIQDGWGIDLSEDEQVPGGPCTTTACGMDRPEPQHSGYLGDGLGIPIVNPGGAPPPSPAAAAGAVAVESLIPEMPSLLGPLADLGALALELVPLMAGVSASAWCVGTGCLGAGGVAAMDPIDKHAEERGNAVKKTIDELFEKKNEAQMAGASDDEKAKPAPNPTQPQQASASGSQPDPKKPNDKKSPGAPKSTLPRDPKTGNFLPDPKAQGAHTTLGVREGRKSSYTQGATFDASGKFKGVTDVTDHGRKDHPAPHFHPATSENGIKSGPHPLPSPQDIE